MKELLFFGLAVCIVAGLLAVGAPAATQGVWTVWQESVFVGNERVFRVASTDKLTAVERTRVIHQRLAVLQENYPGFDPQRIGIVGLHTLPGQKPKSALSSGCPETRDFREFYGKSGFRLYMVIGYFRALSERPFSGELETGSFCAYLIGDKNRSFEKPKFFAYFIPIVTVTPQDAKLHGWGIYEVNLAEMWAKNLRSAFAKLK